MDNYNTPQNKYGNMESIDWFRFEDKELDFPFYKKNPHIPKWGWIVLFIALLIGYILTVSTKIYIVILSCIILIVPVLYFLKWDYKAIFQKPKPKDVALAVGLFVGYIAYALVMSLLLEQFGIISTGVIEESSLSVMTIVEMLFSLMSEEFIKFIPFMFFLRLCFKFSKNRKLSVIISVLLVMAMFASLHAYNYVMLIYALFIQGFGSIFEFIGYIKTKNIIVSYITHLCTDVLIISLALLGL